MHILFGFCVVSSPSVMPGMVFHETSARDRLETLKPPLLLWCAWFVRLLLQRGRGTGHGEAGDPVSSCSSRGA